MDVYFEYVYVNQMNPLPHLPPLVLLPHATVSFSLRYDIPPNTTWYYLLLLLHYYYCCTFYYVVGFYSLLSQRGSPRRQLWAYLDTHASLLGEVSRQSFVRAYKLFVARLALNQHGRVCRGFFCSIYKHEQPRTPHYVSRCQSERL